MSSGAAAGAAAAGAAAQAEQLRRQQEEEEEMTPYSQNDLAEDWEFKILRSQYGLFGYPERLKEILAEESQAGWVLVEKFDNQRIRLKRPAEAKRNDHLLDFDPYRTRFPERMPEQIRRRLLFILALGLGSALVIILIVAAANMLG